MEGRAHLLKALNLWVTQAGRLLEDPATMARPESLRAAAREGAALEESGLWSQMPPGPQSQALFLHGLLELVLGILENCPPEGLRERAGGLIRNARSLDPEVAGPWKERLSPKLKAWLEGLPR
jgi:hypothetical protein